MRSKKIAQKTVPTLYVLMTPWKVGGRWSIHLGGVLQDLTGMINKLAARSGFALARPWSKIFASLCFHQELGELLLNLYSGTVLWLFSYCLGVIITLFLQNTRLVSARQRQEIYALNRVMTTLENKKFSQNKWGVKMEYCRTSLQLMLFQEHCCLLRKGRVYSEPGRYIYVMCQQFDKIV